MRLAKPLGDLRRGYVCVNLGRHDIRVTEERLHRPQVGTAREQVRGERMPQAVWMNVSRQADTPGVPPHQLPDHLARPGFAPRTMKHEAAGAAARRRALRREVGLEMPERHLADGHEAALAAL